MADAIKGAKDLLRRYGEGDRHFVAADLRRANLSGADLRRANLRGADLRRANLSGADLRNAKLQRADLSEADLSGADLRRANLHSAVLSNADLSDADLRRAVSVDAHLYGANLEGADLEGAVLMDANLRRANLRRANLRGANLGHVDLHDANLRDADLTTCELSFADLTGADLRGANVASAVLAWTRLVGLDLSPLCDAFPPVYHYGPSKIDYTSIIRSLRSPKIKAFLQSTGMPDVFVEYSVSCAESLDGSILKRMLQSTFISYGHPDEPFARKVYEALHRNGVTTFFFAEHATPGDKLYRMMRTKINEHDRVILVCSHASLDRKGVLNEIEETLAREARDGGASYLIPIRIDDYVFSGWTPPNPDTAQSVRDHVVADFEGADSDPAKFDAGVLKLIAALKK